MDLGYKAEAEVGVKPLAVMLTPKPRVQMRSGVNSSGQGGSSVARAAQETKQLSPTWLPAAPSGTFLDVRGFVPALPCLGILGLSAARENYREAYKSLCL